VKLANLGSAPSYFAFAAVGMIVALVVNSASESCAYRLREEQLVGTFEALIAHPLSGRQVAIGLVGFPYIFSMGRALLYFAVALPWMSVDVSRTSWLGFATVLTASGVACATFGVLAGALVLVLKRGEILAALSLFVMMLISGSLFPATVLPRWLEAIGRATPLRFAIDGTRDALFRGSGWEADAMALTLYAVVALPLSTIVFNWALMFARRNGSLGQY
jgi:ABC-2 type transport system permease protein